MKRVAALERRTRLERETRLQATQWGTRPKPKKASWRDEFMPERRAVADAKYTAGELAWFAFVRSLPCCVCGRLATKTRPNEASHVTLSADQKGHGMKVPHNQVVSHCPGPSGCHAQWEQRRGFCAGWTRDERYTIGATWVERTRLAAIPEDRNQAELLEAAGLGVIESVGCEGSSGWAWVPLSDSEAA